MKVIGATGYIYYPARKREAKIFKAIKRQILWNWRKILLRKAVVRCWPIILVILCMTQLYRLPYFQEPDMNFCLTSTLAILMFYLISRIQKETVRGKRSLTKGKNKEATLCSKKAV